MQVDLAQLAAQVMAEKGLQPDFSNEVIQQLSQITQPASLSPEFTDLRNLLWCSIDNDDSLDLDQLTYAKKDAEGRATLWVAIADVSALVERGSPIDQHAQFNTTSVYTPAKVFSMLPKKLSNHLTSLNENEDRLSVVVQVQVSQTGDIESYSIFQALVHNYAQLTYNAVGGWLEGKSAIPEKVDRVPGLADTLKTQHEIAQIFKENRLRSGALTLEPWDPIVRVLKNQQIVIQPSSHNFAHQLIEEFMIAANRSMAEHCNSKGIANLRRVVKKPKYWDRIVRVAQRYGENLPQQPDAQALNAFLIKRKQADPENFPELSLIIIKLLGRGEYIVENKRDQHVGHFALALSHYSHSTAPNRRFPDLISQRQHKAYLKGEKVPYSFEELVHLAAHCTLQEDAAMKVERQSNKSAAAVLLSPQKGKVFNGIITGSSEKGVWVRIFQPSTEGKVISSYKPLHVGDKVAVQLQDVDIAKGFIDFALV